MFNTAELCLGPNGTIFIFQSEKIKNPSIPITDEVFKSQRAPAPYIGVNCRPDIYATAQVILPGHMQVEEGQTKLLQK